VQTGKVEPFPIVLVGVAYWEGLVDWIKQRMLDEKCISEEELELFELVDNSEQAAEVILRHIRMGNSNLASER
jgi:predicted Rossmann-fold nucleotide-binding protein